MSDSSSPALRWIAWLAIAVLGVLTVVMFLKSDPAEAPVGPAPPCPHGFFDRPALGEQMLDELRALPAARELVEGAEARRLRYCFGEIARPVIADGRILMLSDELPRDELTARVGHLLQHAVHGSPFPASVAADADCDAIVDEAIAREADAYSLEVTLRAALGVRTARYEFEADARRAPESARVELVERYLRAHPDGAPNLDPLGSAYRQRCEIARAEAQ